MKAAIQHYFEREGFFNVDTPILTTNDCEGGGEVFVVQVRKGQKIKSEARHGKALLNICLQMMMNTGRAMYIQLVIIFQVNFGLRERTVDS